MSTDSPPLESPPRINPSPPFGLSDVTQANSIAVNASSRSYYPPSLPLRDDHVVPINSLPPSPRTPIRRSTPRTPTLGFETRTPSSVRSSSTSSPRSPSRRIQSTRTTRNSGYSTSIDFNNDQAWAIEFGQESGRTEGEDGNGREEEEEEEPLMLPFNYQSIRQIENPRSLPTVKKGKRQSRLVTMRWTVIMCTIAVTVMCWLSWQIVLKGEIEETGEKLLREEMMNLISTRFEKQYNGTVEQILVTGDEDDVEEEVLGQNGDSVTMENGEEFVYRNPFGGTFLKSKLFTSLGAKAQNDTPSLAEEWDFETQTISGVNLGGWLTLEPFITPALFEPFLNSTTPSPAVDEYTLSQNLLHQGGESHLLKVLDHHYRTFITEKDFAEIAGAGLNWVRIPLPFWSISKWPGEPFLERTSWKYFLKALEWSRKYGLRVNLDLHSVPGSQNGWNHSGKWGSINWLHSTMGYANAQRSLDYIETLAEFVSRPEVAEVVKMFSLLNEPMMNVIGTEPLRSFYAKAYRVIRAQTGYNSGPIIAIHDGFKGTRRWFDFPTTDQFRDFPAVDEKFYYSEQSYGVDANLKKVKQTGGLDRVAIDSHRYLAFSEPDTRSVREQILKKWAPEFNKTFNGFGIPIAGEFSIAPNDCGRFLNNVNQGTRLEGTFLNEVSGKPLFNASVVEGSCDFWEDYENWSQDLIKDLRDLAYAQMDTFQNWFYWTWKTAPSLEHPQRFANPLWSYSLGLERGWIPRDPRQSQAFCYSYAERHSLMAGMPRRRARKSRNEMEGWKIGQYTSEDERILPHERASETNKYPWPPKYFYLDPMSAPSSFDVSKPKLEVSTLPRYARTAQPVELPGPPSKALFPPSPVSSRLWHEQIVGCEYPDTWNSLNSTNWSKACLSAF
ncbi:hypothetical protein JCM5350_007531 [Sporobolomyces pararoseus]